MNDERDKLCVLMWDEMSLETNLEYDQLIDIVDFEDRHRCTSLIVISFYGKRNYEWMENTIVFTTSVKVKQNLHSY